MVVYFINLALALTISFQNIFLVFTSDELQKAYMSAGMIVGTITVSLLTTYGLTKEAMRSLHLYVLLDNMFLMQVASSFGFVGFLLVVYKGYWYQVISMIAFPLEIIFFVGNFRVLLAHVRWSRWRLILYKLALLADATLFFEIGAYYMSSGFNYTGGSDTTLDGKVKDFVLLYIFGMFTLFVELYSKMSDIDETAELKFTYQFKEMEEEKKIERIRRSVIGINKQVQQAKSQFMKEAKRRSLLEVEQIQRLEALGFD